MSGEEDRRLQPGTDATAPASRACGQIRPRKSAIGRPAGVQMNPELLPRHPHWHFQRCTGRAGQPVRCETATRAPRQNVLTQGKRETMAKRFKDRRPQEGHGYPTASTDCPKWLQAHPSSVKREGPRAQQRCPAGCITPRSSATSVRTNQRSKESHLFHYRSTKR